VKPRPSVTVMVNVNVLAALGVPEMTPLKLFNVAPVGSAPHALVLFFLLPIFALGSYYLIERPFTRYGHRLAARFPA
jgi:peptidoglycan/LPS O-acetylase OafA/YrhL